MAASAWLRTLANGLLDLVFAPVCVACGGPIATDDATRLICRLCWSRAHPLPTPRCGRCWSPRPIDAAPDAACAVCDALVPGVRCVRSAFVMRDPVREMVHALKYRGWEAAAGPMAERMRAVPLPPDAENEIRGVVPVPVSRPRLRHRGYNQAERLAAAYARTAGWRCLADVLLRTRATETQTALHPDERRANVAHAFAVPPEHAREIEGEHLLLIDDVWTTGATALACAETLLGAGARAVSVLTFARVLPLRERSADEPAKV